MADLAQITDPAYLQGLEGWPLVDVRARRQEATEAETALSYLRRIVQGRLDIVAAENRHRDSGAPADVSALVDELPAILSDNVHAPGLGRLPTLLAPGEVDHDLERRLEEIMPAARLASLETLDEGELRTAAEELSEFERTLSGLRRGVFDVIDRLQEEIVRRYRTGEATVDGLIS